MYSQNCIDGKQISGIKSWAGAQVQKCPSRGVKSPNGIIRHYKNKYFWSAYLIPNPPPPKRYRLDLNHGGSSAPHLIH